MENNEFNNDDNLDLDNLNEVDETGISDDDTIVPNEEDEDIITPEDEISTNNTSEENDDDILFDSADSEKYDDEGELSSKAVNDVDVEGSGNASIVGSTITIGNNTDDDTLTACPGCQSEVDASKYGKTTCSECGFNIYRRNPKLDTTNFPTIDNEKSPTSQYHDVLAHINNNLIRKKYKDAYNFCVKAEKLAPREPTTWEYSTLVRYYYEISIPKNARKDIKDILKDVRCNIKICEANGVSNDKSEEIRGEIANHLYNRSKAQIGTFYAKSKNQTGYWSGRGRGGTINGLKVFEECYRLTGDVYYLQGFVDELSKPYKWIVLNLSSDLINLPACGRRFDAVRERERIALKIKRVNKDYELPEIPQERFDMFFEEEEDGNDDVENGIEIISLE